MVVHPGWFYDDTDPVHPIKISDRGAYVDEDQCIAYRVGAVDTPQIDKAEPLLLECEDFVRAIRTGRHPRASGDAGLEVVRVLTEAQVVRSWPVAARTLPE